MFSIRLILFPLILVFFGVFPPGAPEAASDDSAGNRKVLKSASELDYPPFALVNPVALKLEGFEQEILQRKEIESELGEANAKYMKAQQLGRVGNWEYNIKTKVLWGSAEAVRILSCNVIQPTSACFGLVPSAGLNSSAGGASRCWELFRI